MNDEKIAKILLSEGYITKTDIKKAKDYIKEYKGSVVDFLFAKGIIGQEIFGQALAEHFKVSFVNLEKIKINENVLFLIPELVAHSKNIIAFYQDKDVLRVGMTNPSDLDTIHLIQKKVGQKIEVYYVTPQGLKNALGFYKGTLKDKFNEILSQLKDKSLGQKYKDKLIIEIVDILLEYGQQNKASDIHIEPSDNKIRVRFRIDGVMHQVLELPKNLYDLILARIKILGGMRTDEHKTAQDGRLRFKFNKEAVDVRISIVPTTKGENTVMRLLSSRSRQFNLLDLGLSDNNLKSVQKAIKNPHGMVLVAGPTGSGKTTTLYAILKALNNLKVHISTIEDPVEYDVEGISQIQVNPKTGLTFPKGLRSIVRQDPDIIMIGEIRDNETAGIAVNSALTGHLVLSTLHTNDAVTALPRLINMRVEPFLVASTTNVVIAQRLVRKICQKCKASYKLKRDEIEILKHQEGIKEFLESTKNEELKKINFYKGAGCKVCNNTGYDGRIGVFEALEMNKEIKKLIIEKASSDVLMQKARELGMKTMREDGLEKALNGITKYHNKYYKEGTFDEKGKLHKF